MGEFQVEDGEVRDYRFSLIEKLYNTPLYLLRRLTVGFLKVNLYVVDAVSSFFGFRFEYTLREKPEWKWLKDWKLPRYGVERKD